MEWLWHNFCDLPVFCLGRFQRAGRPAAFWWCPAFFKKLKWRPVFFWWRPMTPCYNFYFAPNITVRGNRRGNYACVSLFYSTPFVIVIRLVYKKPLLLANPDLFLYASHWLLDNIYPMESKNSKLLSRVRDVRYFDFRLGQTIKLFVSAESTRLLFSLRHNNTNAFTFSILLIMNTRIYWKQLFNKM